MMAAIMGSSLNFISVGNDLLGPPQMEPLKSPQISHNHINKKNKDVTLKLSLSNSTTTTNVRPLCLPSSNSQADVKNNELQLEKSQDKIYDYAKTIRIKFRLKRECSFGQRFLIVGDHPLLGSWDPKKAIPMAWSEGHMWSVELVIPIGKWILFKFLMQKDTEEFLWQPGHDRKFIAQHMEEAIDLLAEWESVNFVWYYVDTRTLITQNKESTEESLISNGTPSTMKKSKTNASENMVDSEVKHTKPKGYARKTRRKFLSREGVRVLVPSSSPLPKRDTNQEDESMSKAPMMSTRSKPTLQKDEVESTNGTPLASAGPQIA